MKYQDPIPKNFNFQLQRQRCSRLCTYVERFYVGEKNILKTRYAISCVVQFHNAGIVIRDRRIGSNICFMTFFNFLHPCRDSNPQSSVPH
jgi:hypothetical protein